MMNKHILKEFNICNIYNIYMTVEYNNNYLDKRIWRCRSKALKQDIKINIRSNSIYENIKINLKIIYFITFYCFINNYSIESTLIEVNNNKNLFYNYTIIKAAVKIMK